MIRTVILVFTLIGVSLGTGIPDCTDDTPCTVPNNDNVECKQLKDYIKCIDDKDKLAECVPKSADLSGIEATGACKIDSNAELDACNCQVTFWKTDLNGADQPCKALNKLKTCLDGATKATCTGEGLADLKPRVDAKITNHHCPVDPPTKHTTTTPAPVDCKTEGVCQHGGTCPTDGDNKGKTPCNCPKEYEGPKCETKKNAANVVSPKDGLILTTFISCLIMLFA